jgi:hypothetical protein
MDSENIKHATKQQSNKATKQQSNKATKQQSNKATKQQSKHFNLHHRQRGGLDSFYVPEWPSNNPF